MSLNDSMEIEGHEVAASPRPKLVVKVKKFHAVATWKWQTREDTCGICHSSFDGTCGKCHIPGEDCPPLWGECTHVFHMHCILKWISGKNEEEQVCPLCKRPWR
jgi:anaphase-promoting complex subunit 11